MPVRRGKGKRRRASHKKQGRGGGRGWGDTSGGKKGTRKRERGYQASDSEKKRPTILGSRAPRKRAIKKKKKGAVYTKRPSPSLIRGGYMERGRKRLSPFVGGEKKEKKKAILQNGGTVNVLKESL